MARSRKPSGLAMSGCCEHLLGFLRREHVFGQAVFHPRQDQLGSRIVQQIILPRQPAEEDLDGAQARCSACGRPSGWPLLLR